MGDSASIPGSGTVLDVPDGQGRSVRPDGPDGPVAPESDLEEPLEAALDAVAHALIKGVPPPDLPPALAGNQKLGQILDYIGGIQSFTLKMSQGELNASLRAKGVMAGVLKSLQASLRHLTWQTQQIAAGDFSQRARFMGDFSAAFNTMVATLEKARSDLTRREADLVAEVRERKRIAARLEKALEAAESASRAKSRFLASVSHEIRTPMNAILGFTDILRVQATGETEREYLDIIRSSGEKLLTLMNDILDLAKLETGKTRLAPVPVRLERLMGEIHAIFKPRLAEARIEFILEISPDVPESLYLDPRALRQILFNLVGNAVKFTQKGRVRISAWVEKPTQRHDQRRDQRRDQKRDQSLNPDYDTIHDGPSEAPTGVGERLNLVIAVADTGIGIPPDLQKALFDAFYQVDGGMTRRYEGIGLGLSITMRLVELMGGRIQVDSEPGRGSVFRIEISDVPVMEESSIGDYAMELDVDYMDR